jgi:hypothetical protein
VHGANGFNTYNWFSGRSDVYHISLETIGQFSHRIVDLGSRDTLVDKYADLRTGLITPLWPQVGQRKRGSRL